MCFNSEKITIFLDDLVEIELITTNSKKNYLDAAPESLQLCLKIVIFILHVLSTLCLAIHVFKFFQFKTTLNLSTRNLTLYCFLMLLVYLWIPMEGPLVEHGKIMPAELYSLITIYFLLMPVFIKFIISIDLCLCFRQAVLYLKPLQQSPQNIKFATFCIITGGMPLGILFIPYLIGGLESVTYLYDATKTTIRIVRIIPICAAFWYIRKASLSKKGFSKQYFLHIRILVLIGAVPSILVVMQMIFRPKLYHESDVCSTNDFNLKDLVFTIVIQFRFLVDGLSIGIWFTFKAGTFQSVNDARAKLDECNRRKISEDNRKLDESGQNCPENNTAI